MLSMVSVTEMSLEDAVQAISQYDNKMYLLENSRIGRYRMIAKGIRILGVGNFAKILSLVKRMRRKALYHS